MESSLPVAKKRGRPPSKNKNATTLAKNGKRSNSEDETSDAVDCKYDHWKSTTPILYDWLANHELARPSSSFRWGPAGDLARLYISEQAYNGVPNTLVLADFKVASLNATQPEHICRFEDKKLSPFAKNFKTLVHPGEVTKIRALPQKPNIVATHSDSHKVFIWDIYNQANCLAVHGANVSPSDLLLIGDDTDIQFALALSETDHVLSEGKDKNVSLWSIRDHISTLAVSGSTNPASSNVDSPLRPQKIFKGHTDTVKDVQFCPRSTQEFCSVGDDRRLLLWDARVGSDSIKEVERNDALCCVDWNALSENYILTGSTDSSVCVFDHRKLHDHVHKFENKVPVLCVQWCPDKSSIFGSSGDDRIINIWDYGKADNASSGLVFKHCGHRDKVVDFQWKVNDPYTLVSLSNNFETTGGGAVQIWRMSKQSWSLI